MTSPRFNSLHSLHYILDPPTWPSSFNNLKLQKSTQLLPFQKIVVSPKTF